MYTLRKNIQWLADEAHVKDECGPYVTKPVEWMQEFKVEQLGIDVRRFTTFGVIKVPLFLPSIMFKG